MTRQTKEARAQEALDVAKRVLTRAGDKVRDLEKKLAAAKADKEAAKKRYDYAALNPDLQEQPRDTPAGTP